MMSVTIPQNPEKKSLEVVELATLHIDHDHYQRPLDRNRVEAIRDDWDRDAADELTVSQRADGSLWIVNGQHVAMAAQLEGETEMFAWVHLGLSIPQEADLRLKKNNSRQDTALEKFFARLEREKERPGRATAIRELLNEFDTQVNRSPNKSVGINAVGTIERLYKRDDGVILRRTLRLLQDTYGGLHGQVVMAPLVEGSAWFLTVHFGEYNWKKLVQQMQKEGPDGIHDVARGFKRAMGGTDWLNTYRALLKLYNDTIRKAENKLEMKTSRWTAEESGSYLATRGTS